MLPAFEAEGIEGGGMTVRGAIFGDWEVAVGPGLTFNPGILVTLPAECALGLG